mgnify:CR=1 FL=1
MIRDLSIASSMTVQPVCVEADLKLGQAKTKMETHKVRQLPVTRYGRLAGVLTKQNLKLARANPFHADLTIAEAMDIDPYIVTPDTSLEEVLRDMLHHKLEYAVVARNEDYPVGIFTRQDAIQLLLSSPRINGTAELSLLKPGDDRGAAAA